MRIPAQQQQVQLRYELHAYQATQLLKRLQGYGYIRSKAVGQGLMVSVDVKHHVYLLTNLSKVQSLGAVRESRWPSWAFRPNEPSGFRGRKAILNHAHALVTACP